MRKCPICGSSDLAKSITWDIVTDVFCEDCGWSKNYGTVEGPAGEHWLCPSGNEFCDATDEYDEIDDNNETDEIDEVYDDNDDDDYIPF